MFDVDYSPLPLLLQPIVKKSIERLQESCESDPIILEKLKTHFTSNSTSSSSIKPDPSSLCRELVQVVAGSDFVADQFIGSPSFFLELIESGDLWRSYDEVEYAGKLNAEAIDTLSEKEFDCVLRRFRRREIIRIIWRDLCGFSELFAVTQDMSLMADALIQQSLDFYYWRFCDKWGTPFSSEGELQQLVILGMGKLGAFELNLSSDIDLIFCFPNAGVTRGGKKELDNHTFFIRLGQRLIKSLADTTQDGFVFRVDMRLRPYGESGALVSSFDEIERYYESQGREWERYALIKARVVAGDKESGALLMDRLRPFVFRRYVDFGVIESLREMKALINREVRRKGFEENVKTGSGGIREVEFIAQVFQLMRGGRESELQDRRLRTVLHYLDGHGLLPPKAANELLSAYRFLREAEHRLQALEDRQTQSLPLDELGQARLAFSMGFDGWDFFDVELQRHRRNVRLHFGAVIAPPLTTDESEREAAESKSASGSDLSQGMGLWKELWLDSAGVDQSVEDPAASAIGFDVDGEEEPSRLSETGFEGCDDELLKLMRRLCQTHSVRQMQEVSRDRLDKLMPVLLHLIAQEENCLRTLTRILPLIESIARRSAYISLLLENIGAAQLLIQLCAASPWVAEQLAAHPILLDELLDSRTLFQPLKADELAVELRQSNLRIPTDDLEQQMEMLRHFKRAHVLRVAAAEIVGQLPLMKVSDYLTWIAEALLESVRQLAWQQMTEKYGQPMKDKVTPCDPDFIILAYGKMGGIEMGYGSDLDIVFLHDASITLSTNGSKSVDNVVFFARLGQRIIHLLSTNTPAGKLYEVDMRLRPSGSSGLLVSTLAAFEQYQRQEAWTWEHQALVRARVVTGCKHLQSRLEAVRGQILCQIRDPDELRLEVAAMRQKMRDHLLKPNGGVYFDLKQGVGGIVDIEFIVQYWVLRWAHEHQNLITYTDNVRILEELSRFELIPKTEAHQLTQAYIAYRAVTHRLVLQNQKAQLELEGFEQTPFCQHSNHVRAIWDRLFLS